MTESKSYIGQQVKVIIDRPLGSWHPDHDIFYTVNYGYVPGTISGDGEEVDVYLLGVDIPLDEADGICIAVLHRVDDNDDKLIVAFAGQTFTDEEILTAVHFVEQDFEVELFR
ncbi:MAG: inorganic pyrophosphatase [Chloroflexi bacterium]|nr:inorganic pyrophosphatase [Chloroflexota bacterium]